MSSQVENIVFGFLVRLSPSEGAPLFSLVNPSMQSQLIIRLVALELAPEGAKELFNKKSKNEEDEDVDQEGEVNPQQDDDEENDLPWGVSMAGTLVDNCVEGVKKSFLEKLQEAHPEIHQSIRPLIFLFEDFVSYDNLHIQRFLIGQDLKSLALALCEASEEVKEKFVSNLSSFNKKVVLDEIGYLKDVEPGSPELAREKFLQTLRSLVEEGEIPSLK